MKRQYRSGAFDDLLVDGEPPCDPPDDCTVCRLFDHQRPAEARAAWLDRIVGPPDGAYRWRYQHVN